MESVARRSATEACENVYRGIIVGFLPRGHGGLGIWPYTEES